MADLNVMPWFTDAYLADTIDLTTEEHGAYMLLLIAMWRAGGSLSNDPEFLRRVAKATPHKWAVLWKVLGRFFVADEPEKITQTFLKKVFAQSKVKKDIARSNGSMGGRPRLSSKSLKLRETTKPNGYYQDNQNDKQNETEIEPGGSENVTQKKALLNLNSSFKKRTNERAKSGESKNEPDENPNGPHAASQKPWHDRTTELIEKLIQAATGNVVHGSEGVENVRPILDLLAMDCDLESDILPAVAEHVPKLPDPLRTWAARFLRDAVLSRKAKRLQGRGSSAKPKKEFTPEHLELMAKTYATIHHCDAWYHPDIPRPGKPGCPIPSEVLRKHGIDPETGKRAQKK